ncbi:MAG: hypothetical protein BECKG1743D_GA0114223_102997 [Candidatus Kentron sp. G]|nr:MAG: hypothetical protein BECKG1743F_GA0114225_102737 [Candidatus Kentron sp. G]VFM99965.1 MAG: hypothetical protein BECKG1743E_GA0114224_102947 [Candidatus Kentron sp. G]VFN01663.1 MAG: hypothetical protein BECKG1743D_GA0114223_102997 [Candidatus Kentron sp. G]
MTQTAITNEVRIDAHGQVAIPENPRQTMNLEAGDRSAARTDKKNLDPERREEIVRQLQSLFAHIPKDVSLVDELIAERREEAAREIWKE